MARRPPSPTLIDRIEQELADLETRATELRCALKVVREFTPEGNDSTPDIEDVIQPTFRAAGPGKSRLAAIKGQEIDEKGPDLN